MIDRPAHPQAGQDVEAVVDASTGDCWTLFTRANRRRVGHAKRTVGKLIGGSLDEEV